MTEEQFGMTGVILRFRNSKETGGMGAARLR
jgi:hypothetical protein